MGAAARAVHLFAFNRSSYDKSPAGPQMLMLRRARKLVQKCHYLLVLTGLLNLSWSRVLVQPSVIEPLRIYPPSLGHRSKSSEPRARIGKHAWATCCFAIYYKGWGSGNDFLNLKRRKLLLAMIFNCTTSWFNYKFINLHMFLHLHWSLIKCFINQLISVHN